MAGTATCTEGWPKSNSGAGVDLEGSRWHYIKWTWTSDASGDVSGATGGTTAKKYRGSVIGCWTVPSGSAAPTDNYDVTILDSLGIDVLRGKGADRDAANAEVADITVPYPILGPTTLALKVANAGDTKQGTVYLIVEAPPFE